MSIVSRASDRPDLISRVFKQKLDELMKDLKRGVPFGELEAYVYKVEFQKKGLPHCHMLLTLKDRFKPRSAEVVDQLVCAEIPSICKGEDDDGIRSLVMLHMVHGPCGTSHPSAHCMEKMESLSTKEQI
ncbi:putative Helitron helicase-like domain at N-terminus [Monocercomonoides exilis]|uniref:putative Helitron helicase-like domain at N-terminus n=1 Tax=Monocercomonoides exilis TaxID=2049356 RepID=UPI0035595C79|nr:putative Helitron helicase-like domain at N-terminus [Monocercomonoides exilis]|eukprot:MONOS_5621.1-p1 / transcript=MONOS_5621.1 / gene=MONOS_5621 / organism=Monocercomonoides_exilis_PA203 / gene_product=uncharacterized protein LOC100898668 / transcript_product=uncharacterized protein LOC100898668 / location=Mono_scaffold00166:11238-11769(+) / protein_length=128 / sequence_SO=supercontig / SO=protein_coding / is_pseudo=false